MDCIRNQVLAARTPEPKEDIKESTLIEYQMTKKALRRSSAASVINWSYAVMSLMVPF